MSFQSGDCKTSLGRVRAVIAAFGICAGACLSTSSAAASPMQIYSRPSHNWDYSNIPSVADPSVPPDAPPIESYPDPVIPLMEPLPFPWSTIEGVWQSYIDGQVVRYSLEVRSDAGGRNFLHVVQLGDGSNQVTYQGNGFADEHLKTVRAGMIGNPGAYMLFIGAYKNEKVVGQPQTVMILTVRSFRSVTQEFSVIIEKVEANPVKL